MESDYQTESEMETTGALDSRNSMVRLQDANKNYISLNLFIQMEYCEGENLHKFIEKRGKPDRAENLTIFE